MKITTDYDQFHLLPHNREVSFRPAASKKLAEQMLEHGWLDAFPLLAIRKNGKLYVLDGQHRLQVAKDYGLPVKYVVTKKQVDVAGLNSTSKAWTSKDYIHRYVEEGNHDYQILSHFIEKHELPASFGAKVLGGNDESLPSGKFKVKNMDSAQKLGDIYNQLKEVSPLFKGAKIAGVVWNSLRVDYFSGKRLVQQAKRNPHLIRRAANIEDASNILEKIYNHNKRDKKPLAFDSMVAAKNARSHKGTSANH